MPSLKSTLHRREGKFCALLVLPDFGFGGSITHTAPEHRNGPELRIASKFPLA
jgi:hypothetical protein